MAKKSSDHLATLSIEEAATRLGIGRNQAYQAAAAKQIPAIRIGSRWLVLRAPFERLLAGETDA